jgi:ArsR family transcriptional regulator, arsenate/arsenite/antimonite-responsive transcriptional repressor
MSSKWEVFFMTGVALTMTKTRLDAIFKALASEHRREILRILGDSTPEPGKTCCGVDETCACKLSDSLGLSAPTISHHMSVLRAAGLVDGRKDGVWTYYTLRREALDEAAEELRRL